MVVLRPLQEGDIPNYANWYFIDTEWGNWDGPWEEMNGSEMLKDIIDSVGDDEQPYSVMQIETDGGKHIGRVSLYYDTDDENALCVGLCIYSEADRGKGYGKAALLAWIDYIFKNYDVDRIYTRTWSGNVAMVALAEKVGFEEVACIKDFRLIKGQRYDGLTFRLMK